MAIFKVLVLPDRIRILQYLVTDFADTNFEQEPVTVHTIIMWHIRDQQSGHRTNFTRQWVSENTKYRPELFFSFETVNLSINAVIQPIPILHQ